jgi:hypothetical protein
MRTLEELPFFSVRRFARAVHLPATAVERRLYEKLGFAAHHLRWVPYRLPDDRKMTRVQWSWSILAILRTEQARDWHDIVTLDELWFYYMTDEELVWLPRVKKFQIGNTSRFSQKDPHYCVKSDWVFSGDRP